MTSDLKEIIFRFSPMYGKYFFDRFQALSFVFLIPATQLKLYRRHDATQILHELAQYRTQISVVADQRLVAWSMARPLAF